MASKTVIRPITQGVRGFGGGGGGGVEDVPMYNISRTVFPKSRLNTVTVS